MIQEIALAAGVGLVIGVFFKAIKLPVPVPHGYAGMVGLIGMFFGGEFAAWALTALMRK